MIFIIFDCLCSQLEKSRKTQTDNCFPLIAVGWQIEKNLDLRCTLKNHAKYFHQYIY